MREERRAQSVRARVERMAAQAQILGLSAPDLGGLSDTEWRAFASDAGVMLSTTGDQLSVSAALLCGEVVDLVMAEEEAALVAHR